METKPNGKTGHRKKMAKYLVNPRGREREIVTTEKC